MRRQPSEHHRPDPGDPVELGNAAECPSLLAICHDAPRQRRPDAGQPPQFGRTRLIDIDPLGGPQWRRERPGTIPMGKGIAISGGIEQRHRRRRLAPPGANQVPGDPQGQDQQQGTTLGGGHAEW